MRDRLGDMAGLPCLLGQKESRGDHARDRARLLQFRAGPDARRVEVRLLVAAGGVGDPPFRHVAVGL
jgi:hypothetical protein